MDKRPQPTRTDAADAPRRRWLRWLRDIVLLLSVFAAVQWWQSRDLAHGTAPPLNGLLLDGSPWQFAPADGPQLVHFWATWCPICRLEHDSIASIAADWPVITVATTSGTPDEVRAYLAERDLSLPVLIDEGGDIARQWGLDGVPATFVVDADGKIRHAAMGFSTEWGLRLRLWLAG
jgi:thiol-disulfide isomerase/thioredoxin